MLIASLVPATASSNSLVSNSSGVGFKMNSPSLYPTTTPATGPKNGKSDNIKAIDEPIIPR